MIKKTYGLVRISSHSQNEENGGTGVEFQTKKLNQYAELNDYEIGEIFVDECSGSLAERDGITKLKHLIDDGKVERVLIWNTSRAFRSMIHFARFYEMLKKNDVELVSVSEGIKSSNKTGEMMFGIMCSIAGYEKELINERMKSGKITKLQKGERAFGGRLPYGYKKDNGEIVLDEMEGKAVKYIYKTINRLNKKGYTKIKRTNRILTLLKKNGYKYKGENFKAYHLRVILGNEFYIGELNYGGTSTKHIHPTIISKRLFNSTLKGIAY
jgi:site-specific DNA recombinase